MMNDLSADERIELSVHSPNLLSLLGHEPPREVEETRKRAREEVAGLLRETQRLRIALRGNGKLTLEFTRPELLVLFEELGDVPAKLIKPKLMSFYRRLAGLAAIDWLEEDPEKKRKRK